MAKLLIVYHSQSGASAALARAAEEGAAEQDVVVVRGRAVDMGSVEVSAADGLLLVCAENGGRLAGGAKDFLDRVFYPLIEREKVLPFALLISAGNDGTSAVAEAQRIFRGIPFSQCLEPRIVLGRPDAAGLEVAREQGETLAAGLSIGMF